MSSQAIQGEDIDVADGGCITTVRESPDLVQPEVELDHGARVRSMSYHAMNPMEISSKVTTSRRYLSSIVIDDNLRQTLTTNQRPEMVIAQYT
ncbi:hypothetical protein ANCCAN_17181, partial [Ancylostoma caninum]